MQDNDMREKLEKIISAYEELQAKMSDPSVLADQKAYNHLAKEYANQGPLAAKAREYLACCSDIDDAKEMLADPDMKEFAQETIASALGTGGSVISTASVPLPSDPAAIEKEKARPLYELPRTLIRNGQKTGEFASALDADAAASILVTTLRGYAMDWSRRSFSYDFLEAIREYMAFFLRSLS